MFGEATGTHGERLWAAISLNMESNKNLKGVERLLERQMNITPPDVLRNSRGVDEFLWKGRSNPTPVQRVGAALCALALLISGVVIVWLGFSQPRLVRLVVLALSVPLFVYGGRAVHTAFRR